MTVYCRDLADVARRLDQAGLAHDFAPGKHQIKASCPLPGHTTPDGHLSITDKGDRFLIHCIPGPHKSPEILAALGIAALSYSPNGHTPAPKRKGKLDCTYPYTDETGHTLYQVVRLKDPKGFYQRRPGPDGSWINNLQGVRLVLFRLQDVLAAKRAGRVICVTEGEKDAYNVAALGLSATTNAMGATKWKPEYTETLAGADVVILPDNDTEGEKHAQVVIAALRGKAARLRLVRLPDRAGQHVKDVSDWIAAGGTRGELDDMIAQAPLVEASPHTSDDGDLDAGLAGLPEFRPTDMWNGESLVHLAGRDLRFDVSERAEWLVWTGTHWQWDPAGCLVEERAKVVVRALYRMASEADTKDERDKLASWATKSEASARVRDMVHMARSEPQIRINMADLDKDPDLFNVRNGTIDLRTGELRPHRREDLITKCAPVDYDPAASSDLWDECVDAITCGDRDLQHYLAKAVGYALTGHAREDLVFFLYGKGRNGKSTFMATVAAMMGEYAGTIHASELVEDRKRNTGHRDAIAALAGKRLVIVSECPERMKLDMGTLKSLTGGDLVSASHKYGRTFEFKPQFTPFLYGNSKPRVAETDEGTWRRLRLIKFLARFERGKGAREGLREELAAHHLAAVLRWAVAGAQDWYREGLHDVESVAQATEEYRDEEDNVGRFLRECCDQDVKLRAMKLELHNAYCEWCKADGESWAGYKTFNQRMVERGYSDGQSGKIRYWKGIALHQLPGAT